MSFLTLEFAVFFLCAAAIYYLLPAKIKNYWLLAVSAVFYWTWSPVFLAVLAGIGLLTFLMGLGLEKHRDDTVGKRRLLLVCGLCLSLILLVIIKYGDFALRLSQRAASLIGWNFGIPGIRIAQPLGISFFSLQAAGYLIDVYRGKRKAARNPAEYLLFLMFFPTIVSGPVERSTNLLEQIERKDVHLDTFRIRHGLLTVLYGAFLKMIIADRLNLFVNGVFDNYQSCGGSVTALAVVAFGLQLYCDFRGISAIAVGMGEVLGFSLIDNFRTPYLSRSSGEFWRNWHVSLSSWFRDYLYIPLGGNRKGKARKYLNTLIVFTVSGLWHGAGTHYVFWGLLNGLYIVIGELFKPIRVKITKLCGIDPQNAGNRFLQTVFTFLLINLAWLFFRAPSLTIALDMLKTVFTKPDFWELWTQFGGVGLSVPDAGVLFVSMVILLAVSLSEKRGTDWRTKLLGQGFAFRLIIYTLCVMAVLIFGVYGPGFNAASFIYADF